MCGIVGILNLENVSNKLFLAMQAGLQHRGQDAAGIATFNGSSYHLVKDLGLVSQVFSSENLKSLDGFVGIGHTRYPTTGETRQIDAQPFVYNKPLIMIAANGNVTNNSDLIIDLLSGNTYLHSTSMSINGKDCGHDACDADVMGAVLSNIFSDKKINNPTADDIFSSLKEFYSIVKPSYSVVAVINDKLVAFRDEHGIRPLAYGKQEIEGKISYMVASESAPLEILGFTDIKDVLPGQAIVFERGKEPNLMQIGKEIHNHCIFEHIYFARPDSMIDDISVYEARYALGKELGKEWKRKGLIADIVVPVPDTARPAAQGFYEETQIPLKEGLLKNRYVGRTFIAPESVRSWMQHIKMTPIKAVVKGKSVVAIDDSIVRGHTSKNNIQLLWDAGAKEVHFAVISPPTLYSCPYGINTSRDANFIATGKTEEEIARLINATSLTYLPYDKMVSAVGIKDPCAACFSGRYPTEIKKLEN